MSTPNLCWIAPCSAVVYGVKLCVGAAVAVDPSNYWKVDVFHRRTSDEFGEIIGTWSGHDRLLHALPETFVLYDDLAGRSMAAGDLLVAVATKTGSPAALVDPALLLDRKLLRR